jgi:hypothetical protein
VSHQFGSWPDGQNRQLFIGNKNLAFGYAVGVGIIDSTLPSIIEENGKSMLEEMSRAT